MPERQNKHSKKQKKSRVFGPVAVVFDSENTGSWRLVRPSVNYSKCIKCGTCQTYCPPDVIEINKKEEKTLIIDFEYCKGCGICANVCPVNCIEMVPERGGDK